MKRTLLTVSAAVLLLSASTRVLWAEARVESNVLYGMYSSLALLMDVHYPADPNGFGIVFIATNRFHTPLNPDAEPTKQRADTHRNSIWARPSCGLTAIYAIGRSRSRQYREQVTRAFRMITE